MRITEVSAKRTHGHNHGRMYVFVNGESILENLANRKTRPYTEYKKLMDDSFWRKVDEALTEKVRPRDWHGSVEILRDQIKWGWNQYAGCSCPCSPGFVAKGGDKRWLVRGYEIFVTVGE